MRRRPADAVQREIQRARGAQHAHRAQHRHQVGQQVLRHVEALFRAVDEAFEQRHALVRPCAKEQQDHAEQHQVAEQAGQRGQRRRGERGEQRHEAAEQQAAAQQPRQHHRIAQLQALHAGHRQQAGEVGAEMRQQGGQEHQGGVVRTGLRAVHEHRHRQQGERGGVEHQEQDLRVARGVFRRVQRLQLAHRAQADGRGRVVQAQRVRGEVQRDQADGGMAARHARHQPGEQRAEQPRQLVHQTRLLGDAQEAQPQRQRAEQQQQHLDRQVGHVEQRGHDRGEHARVAPNQPARQRGHRRRQEEAEPQAAQHAGPMAGKGGDMQPLSSTTPGTTSLSALCPERRRPGGRAPRSPGYPAPGQWKARGRRLARPPGGGTMRPPAMAAGPTCVPGSSDRRRLRGTSAPCGAAPFGRLYGHAATGVAVIHAPRNRKKWPAGYRAFTLFQPRRPACTPPTARPVLPAARWTFPR